MQLRGKRVLITGAGSGIGRALAIEAARLGMAVALSGRRAEALAETLAQMEDSRAHLRLRGDITDPAIRRHMRDYLWRQWSGLDILINNAGVFAMDPLTCVTDEALAQMAATNIVAPLALSRDMLPLLRRGSSARIVNVGSVYGDIPYPLLSPYSASKFALRGLSGALRRELRQEGIGVTYAAPRGTQTAAADVLEPLRGPLKLTFDAPEKVAAQIWRGVRREKNNVYPKGPERFFVLVQKFMPWLVDRAIAKQMADPRIGAFVDARIQSADRSPRNKRGDPANPHFVLSQEIKALSAQAPTKSGPRMRGL